MGSFFALIFRPAGGTGASGGTQWKNIGSTTLSAGTYYMYATISATTNYSGATTAVKQFTVGVAQVAGVMYISLQAAFDAVPSTGTATAVDMLANVTENLTVASSKNIELHMESFKIKGTITNAGNLGIKGSGNNVIGENNSGYTIDNSGSLYVWNTKIKGWSRTCNSYHKWLCNARIGCLCLRDKRR